MIRFVILTAAVFVDFYIPRSGELYSGEPGWMKLKAKRLSSLEPKLQCVSPVSIYNSP